MNVKNCFKLLITLSFLISTYTTFAQSVSKKLKEAKNLSAQGNCAEAIKIYDAILLEKSTNKDALEERANCFLKLKNYDKAIDDAKMLVNISPKNIDHKILLSKSYFEGKKYTQCSELLAHLIIDNPEIFELYDYIINSKLNLKDNEGAILYCNEALAKLTTNHYFYFLKGVALDSTRNFQLSTLSYSKAIEILELDKKISDKKPYINYYKNLGIALLKIQRWEDAARAFNGAIKIDKDDISCYILLGDAFSSGRKYQSALDNFNLALQFSPNNIDLFFKRAQTLKNQKRFIDAIEEFNKIIEKDSTYILAYLEKGKSLEELNDFEKAEKVYSIAKSIDKKNKTIDTYIEANNKRSYDHYKESDKPEIIIISPENEKFTLMVSIGRSYVDITGKIKDNSKILSIMVGNVEATFDKNQINPVFSATVSTENISQIKVKATDVYYNTTTSTYSLNRIEKNPPIVIFTDPIASSSKEVYISKEAGNSLTIKGIIDDESPIKSILVNGLYADFSSTEINPKFSLTIDVKGIDTISIEAIDAYNNYSKTKYTINRKAVFEAEINPMGITWVVFIENSNYSNFTSLDGPAKDREKLKKALINYRIDNFIVKNDLTKDQLEKFFSIELRNMLKTAQVSSVLIWYAGHGRYISENGYWIPVNANKTDEFSFFQITNLKGYLSTYKFLKHALVVSDACETGSAFCISSTQIKDPGDCKKTDAVKNSSFQVFTSSNSESSSDESLFAETFCNLLKSNPDKCLPVEKVAKKVIETVEKEQKQKPTFGIIPGLNNQNGSFYFIKN
jgi:tetratricopeptide (TPR) repeat protein